MMVSALGNPKPCDVEYLVQLLGGERPAAWKLAQLFLDVYPGKVDLVNAALKAGDWVALRRSVHDLRGSCALFSATTCVSLASKIESALPDHVAPDLSEDCERFKDTLADVARELREFLDSEPGSASPAAPVQARPMADGTR